jgi:hypothetical protein
MPYFMKLPHSLLFLSLFVVFQAHTQNLNWSTSGYVANTTFHNFGSIGSPASAVTLTVTGTPTASSGPAITNINSAGTAFDCTSCALRTAVTFTNYTGFKTFTFTFSPAVIGLSFNVYDIDGDSVVINANGSAGARNVSITPLNGSMVKIVGNNTSSASVTGNNASPFSYSNQDANPNGVSIGPDVSTLTISYYMHQRDPALPGSPSFSIGNMFWLGVLPTKLISFSCNPGSNGLIDLKWVTNNEINADHYDIEKSNDGNSFVKIGQLTALRNASNQYTYSDINPGFNNFFYRLKRVDEDGKFEFSDIVHVKKATDNINEFMILPNPASNYIMIHSFMNQRIVNVKIFDAMGGLRYQNKDGKTQIDIGPLSLGQYYLQAEYSSGTILRKAFFKQ